MKRVTFPICLTVQGPIITKSSSIGAVGFDTLMAKGSFVNGAGRCETRFYLPGRLIKGLLREAWQELSVFDKSYGRLIHDWLGEKSAPESNDDPIRGRLFFSDFADFTTDPYAPPPQRCRIQIDEMRGAAAGQMLQVIESPYQPGKPVAFDGEVRAVLADTDNLGELRNALERGLLWIRAVGGTRTSGFGQVAGVKVGPEAVRAATVSDGALSGTVWNLRLTFTEPLILSKHRIADNLFESGEMIPGAALKGAIADMIKQEPAAFKELAGELHLVHFTHAFPSEAGATRPLQWPLSLYSFSDEDIVNTVRLTEPLIRKDSAGAFDIDWKEGVAKAVRKTYRWPVIARELRVRTAIDSGKRKAKDQDLFAWQMLKPYGIEWNATADSAALSGPAREQLYRLLLLGLEPIGKTQARSSVAISPANQGAVVTAPDYQVTLQTPALLIDPSRHLAPGGSIGSAKEDDLRKEYEEVWTNLSHGSLELINYFQRCSLAGGEYYWRRFSKAKGQYKPYLLSDAGSTFLLKAVVGQESEGLGKLNEWRSHGLPLSQEICAFYRIPNDVKVQWDHCPYVPQNGYGEIAVNEKCPYPEA